jgi:hypothetical protein
VKVGRVEVDVGELDVVQPARPERGHDLIETGADPRDLRLGHPRVDAEGGDQVVDGAGGDAADVGLHDDCVERLVDAAARFEDDREVRPLAQLRDPQLDVAGLGGQQPVTCAVALGGPGIGAFVSGSADPLGRLGLDQLLHHHPHRLADQVDAFAGAKRLEQLGHGRLG